MLPMLSDSVRFACSMPLLCNFDSLRRALHAIMSTMRSVIAGSLVSLALSTIAWADEAYKKPTQDILRVLEAAPTPDLVVSPSGKQVLFIERILYPPIAHLAEPMLRIAGLRINPRNNGPHNVFLYRSIVLTHLDGSGEIKIDLPPGAEVSSPQWSPDDQSFAFENYTAESIELWIGSGSTGKAHKIVGVRVNAALSGPSLPLPVQWMPDSRTLLVETVPANRGEAPVESAVPPGPHTQESMGKAGPAPTYEDLMKNAHDEDLFDYYAATQLMLIDRASGTATPYGKQSVFGTVEPSPDGKQVLVARIHKPYSYFHPVGSFAREVEVWDSSANVTFKVASLPLQDRVPIEGVPTGPRNYHWIPTESASLYWVEAMDGGNPKEMVPHRDRILAAKLPLSQREPQELMKVEQRFTTIEFGESGTLSLVTDYERKKRWVRTFALNPQDPAQAPKLIWSRNMQDRYKDPGAPDMRLLPNGKMAMRQDNGAIFLKGLGATPQGDYPFLDRYDLKTGSTQHLFRSDDQHYEVVEAILTNDGGDLITRRESPADSPNFFLRRKNAPPVEITHYPDPAPELRKVSRQLVTYKRPDGVPLSFTLYLPPAYKPGTRLPTVVWAYPYEYNDADTAGQISGSTKRFTSLLGASEVYFALRGYAVLDNAAMPVIGDPETVKNTYLDQIVMDAKAAIDKATQMGVTDPDRVGVGGHSYGAFMTANLLAHSTLFKAGIARSGAYNRTLTPFGFQTERRTIWEAPDVYLKMSPFLSAEKIKGALLMIHGEADDNTGTFPIQSERMYAAVRGNGGIVRLVTLPYEAHGYRGLESIEHVVYEEISWFDKYVRDAGSGQQAFLH